MVQIQSLLGLSLGFIGLCVGIVQPAIAETISQRSGNVHAELSYDIVDYRQKNLQLKISRNGEMIYNQALPVSDSDRLLLNSERDQKVLKIIDLDGDREPEILVDLFTGGAHCCIFSLIYRYEPSQKNYTQIQHNWRDVGYELKDLREDGNIEFDSLDARFAYQFACFACSVFPLQIWQYRSGKMLDVTHEYPNLVKEDADKHWKLYLEERQKCAPTWGGCGEAVLAAYLADRYLLGEGVQGWQQVKQTYIGEGCEFDKCEGREAFFKRLQLFLQDNGYIR